ncbi:MAG: septum formation protein Maf, partial [Thermoguttaceae bacterium]|nr:septum formation protein Maf [Thermoguttaceae bacterium]
MNPFQNRKIILASNSPRRRELMTQAGFCFQVLPADGNVETPYDPAKFKSPADYVSREALLKAQNVARRFPEEDLVVIGCDTVAVCAGEILGKPSDRADAERMLRLLSGSEHEVISGLCLLNPALPDATLVESVVTRLVMDQLSDEDLQAYLDSNQWQGKAGAFGYQDGIAWLHILSGTESNVVGLPIERLEELLKPKGGWFH